MTALQKEKAPAQQRQSFRKNSKTTVLNQYSKPWAASQVAATESSRRVLPSPTRPVLRLVTPTSTRIIISTVPTPHLEPNAALEGNFDYIDAESEQNEARFAAFITANAANTPRPKPRNPKERIAARRTYRPNRASDDWLLLDELGVL